MKKVVHRKYGWVIIVVLLGLFLCIIPLSSKKVLAREFADRVNITLYYRVRFESLGESPKGLYYIDLFDRYTAEITQLAINHPAFFVESLSILKEWEPKLDAFVNGRGEEITITEDDVNGVLAYLDHLTELASPELRSVIDMERSVLPLETTIGMNMNQVWSYLSRDPRFPAVPDMGRYTYPDSFTNPMVWMVPEAPKYTLNVDPNLWELLLWNNGVAASWELKHRSLYDCVVTIPRVLADPYSHFDVTTRTVGELSYEVRTARFSEFTFYAIYKPLVYSVSGEFMFIIYPGYVDTQACLEESEALLGNLHVSP